MQSREAQYNEAKINQNTTEPSHSIDKKIDDNLEYEAENAVNSGDIRSNRIEQINHILKEVAKKEVELAKLKDLEETKDGKTPSKPKKTATKKINTTLNMLSGECCIMIVPLVGYSPDSIISLQDRKTPYTFPELNEKICLIESDGGESDHLCGLVTAKKMVSRNTKHPYNNQTPFEEKHFVSLDKDNFDLDLLNEKLGLVNQNTHQETLSSILETKAKLAALQSSPLLIKLPEALFKNNGQLLILLDNAYFIDATMFEYLKKFITNATSEGDVHSLNANARKLQKMLFGLTPQLIQNWPKRFFAELPIEKFLTLPHKVFTHSYHVIPQILLANQCKLLAMIHKDFFKIPKLFIYLKKLVTSAISINEEAIKQINEFREGLAKKLAPFPIENINSWPEEYFANLSPDQFISFPNKILENNQVTISPKLLPHLADSFIKLKYNYLENEYLFIYAIKFLNYTMEDNEETRTLDASIDSLNENLSSLTQILQRMDNALIKQLPDEFFWMSSYQFSKLSKKILNSKHINEIPKLLFKDSGEFLASLHQQYIINEVLFTYLKKSITDSITIENINNLNLHKSTLNHKLQQIDPKIIATWPTEFFNSDAIQDFLKIPTNILTFSKLDEIPKVLFAENYKLLLKIDQSFFTDEKLFAYLKKFIIDSINEADLNQLNKSIDLLTEELQVLSVEDIDNLSEDFIDAFVPKTVITTNSKQSNDSQLPNIELSVTPSDKIPSVASNSELLNLTEVQKLSSEVDNLLNKLVDKFFDENGEKINDLIDNLSKPPILSDIQNMITAFTASHSDLFDDYTIAKVCFTSSISEDNERNASMSFKDYVLVYINMQYESSKNNTRNETITTRNSSTSSSVTTHKRIIRDEFSDEEGLSEEEAAYSEEKSDPDLVKKMTETKIDHKASSTLLQTSTAVLPKINDDSVKQISAGVDLLICFPSSLFQQYTHNVLSDSKNSQTIFWCKDKNSLSLLKGRLEYCKIDSNIALSSDFLLKVAEKDYIKFWIITKIASQQAGSTQEAFLSSSTQQAKKPTKTSALSFFSSAATSIAVVSKKSISLIDTSGNARIKHRQNAFIDSLLPKLINGTPLRSAVYELRNEISKNEQGAKKWESIFQGDIKKVISECIDLEDKLINITYVDDMDTDALSITNK